VTAVEIGDLDRGYRAIDVSGKDARLYSLTCPLYLGIIVVAIPKYTKGALTLVPKNRDGQPLKSRVEALDDRRGDTPYLRRRRVRRTRVVSPPGQETVLSGRSRNGRRSWITSVICQSRTQLNYPLFQSMSEPQRSGRSDSADANL
jgi:hypothetical protein